MHLTLKISCTVYIVCVCNFDLRPAGGAVPRRSSRKWPLDTSEQRGDLCAHAPLRFFFKLRENHRTVRMCSVQCSDSLSS